jgi:phage-related protein
VRFNFHESSEKNWMLILPQLKFDEFNKKLIDLVQEIENWLKKHSAIPIDLKFEEPNQYFPNKSTNQ